MTSRRNILVVGSMLLSVMIGFVLSGPAARPPRSTHDDEKVLIGLSLGTLQEERWQRDRERFVRRAEELGAEVLVQSGNSDTARQTQDIESLSAGASTSWSSSPTIRRR